MEKEKFAEIIKNLSSEPISDEEIDEIYMSLDDEDLTEEQLIGMINIANSMYDKFGDAPDEGLGNLTQEQKEFLATRFIEEGSVDPDIEDEFRERINN